jgi:hypothetical protein
MSCRILNLTVSTSGQQKMSVDFESYRRARLSVVPLSGSPSSLRLSTNESLTKSSTKNTLYSIPVATTASPHLNLDGLVEPVYFWVDSGAVRVSILMWDGEYNG